jgi:ketosteroid isomerase-like protein
MGSDENREVVQQLYIRFGQGDVEGIMSLLSPSVAWQNHGPQSVPLYVPCQGREAVRKWLELIAREFEIAEFVTDTFVAERDHVVVLGREKGTVRQTGRAYATQFAHVFRVSDGQIVTYDGFEDSSAMVAALGG